MASSPVNMYQKQTALKRKRLEPSSSQSSPKVDKHLQAENIPFSSLLPPSPTINRSANIRKFSLITLNSDSSDHGEHDENSNVPAVEPPKKILSKFPQKAGKGNKLQKLHLAALSGNETEVQKFLKKGIDVNSPDSFGKTPLHNAILGKHVGIVEQLLTSGANVKCIDERGDSPLHAAAKVSSEAIVTLLLNNSKKGDPNIKGHGSYTPLHIAAQSDNVDICKLLVENGGDITLQAEDKMTPFGVSVAKGAQSVAEYFISIVQEKQLNLQNLIHNTDSEGSSLLHLAVDSGIVPIVELCLKLGCDERQQRESDNSTALHLACAQGSLEIVQLMIGEKRDLCKAQILDDQGMVPLHRAAQNNHVTVVNYLLDQGAQVDPRDTQGRTPLFLAASVGGTASVQTLMDHGADITVKDTELRSPLHVAIGNSSTIEALMKSSSAKALVIEKDVTGYTAVHYAARAGYFQDIALFVSKNKPALKVTSDSLDTPLHIAARYGWLEIAEKLLGKRNVRVINLQNNQGKTPLHYACYEGHEQIVQHLLAAGATIESDHHDRTPLHMAAIKGSERCVEVLLDVHPECLNAVDNHQNTALNMAATAGHASLVSHLLSLKGQEILLNKCNQNVLDIAVANDKEGVAMAIIEHSRWKEALDSAVGGGFSLIQTLVEKMPDVAKRVLDQCVERDGDPTSKDFKITYDLRLIQGKQDSSSALEHSLDALRTMAERRRENCLTHPVCFALMSIKWKKFGWITFLLNLLFYLMFLLPFTALAVYLKSNACEICNYAYCNTTDKFPEDESEWHYGDGECKNNNKTVTILHYIMIIFALIHLLKEIVQLIRHRLKYFLSITNCLELLVYASSLVFAFPICACKPHYKAEAAALSLFFAWINLALYFRRFSYYGKYVIMLATMFQTLLQVLLLFFLFVVAFGTTFYLLMYNKEFQFYQFALLKTFAMTLGELDYENDFIKAPSRPPYPEAVNIVFVLFALSMPIILMNMLIGLAVGDIDTIQKKSVMERYVMQVELLLEIEESLPKWILRRVQVDKYEEFPNRRSNLGTKVYDMIIGLGKAESMEDDDALSPGMTQILEKIAEQESKIDDIYELLQGQSKSKKAIGQREGLEESGNRRSIFGGFFKKKFN